jgi:hypothetical protein
MRRFNLADYVGWEVTNIADLLLGVVLRLSWSLPQITFHPFRPSIHLHSTRQLTPDLFDTCTVCRASESPRTTEWAAIDWDRGERSRARPSVQNGWNVRYRPCGTVFWLRDHVTAASSLRVIRESMMPSVSRYRAGTRNQTIY